MKTPGNTSTFVSRHIIPQGSIEVENGCGPPSIAALKAPSRISFSGQTYSWSNVGGTIVKAGIALGGTVMGVDGKGS
jgi:hypothetical protein